MRIGIDAGTLRHSLTGIGWALKQNLTALLKLAPADEFLLYASRRLKTELPTGNLRVRTARFASFLPGTFWLQAQASRRAAQDRLDCFWGPSHILPLSLPRTIRAVLTINDLVPLVFPDSLDRYNAFVHRQYLLKSVHRADALLAISEHTKTDIVNRLGIAPEKVTVTPLGVEEGFRALPAELVESRLAELKLKPGYLLAVGTLEPRKNYPFLFRALARMPEDVMLIVVGRPGWKYKAILQEIDRLGIARRVKLMNYVSDSDLIVLYNGARLLVMPSLYEGFGLPVLQAMAVGTPVLSSNSSSLPEVGGTAAKYFDPHNEDSLYSALNALVTDDEELNRMKLNGIERARLFTWERTAELTFKVLRGEAW